MLDRLAMVDAWLFYSLHWAEIAVYVLVGMNAARMLWDAYGC